MEWLLASLHLLALAVGFGAIIMRATTLRRTPLTGDALKRVFSADNLWGMAAMLWLATGIPRAFFGEGKGTEYYLNNPFFHAKMGLFSLILALEVWPMIRLIQWRVAEKKGNQIDTSSALTFSRISVVQAILLVAMIFTATAMARSLRF
jgi:putative membrane protein